jgi:hypothetical protein
LVIGLPDESKLAGWPHAQRLGERRQQIQRNRYLDLAAAFFRFNRGLTIAYMLPPQAHGIAAASQSGPSHYVNPYRSLVPRSQYRS